MERAYRPRTRRRKGRAPRNSHRPEGQHGIICPINRRAVRTRPGYDRRGSPKRALDPARDWRRARGGPRGCRCASGRLRRARDRAPMCRRTGSAPPRRWEKKIRPIHLRGRGAHRGPNFSCTAVCPFTPVKRSDNVVRISTPPTRPARTHGRTHAFEDGRRHRDPQAGRRRDIPQARSGRHRPLHRCATRRLPRKSQTRARGDERLLIPPRRVASRLPAPGSTRI